MDPLINGRLKVSLMTPKAQKQIKNQPENSFEKVIVRNQKDADAHQECDPDSPA